LDIENSSIELKYLKCELIIAEKVKEKGERKMKTKLFAVVAMVLLAMSVFAVLPAFPYETKAVKYIDPEELELTGPCTESYRFDAKVKITNVEDLYAWDISVYWDTVYLRLEGYVIQVPTGWPVDTYSIIINQTDLPVKPLPAPSASWLHFAVTRLGNVSGFTGTTTLAILSFHVIYEPLWPETKTTYIQFGTDSLSSACGKPIDHITDYSTITLISSQPNMEVLFSDTFDLTKNETQGWKKNQVITAYVWLSNVAKLYEVKVKIKWNTTLLYIDEQQITINQEKFPMPWANLTLKITHDTWDSIEFTIARPDEEEKYLKGTFWLLKLDFKVKCVMNTTNTQCIPLTTTKTGVPIPCDTWIEPVDGYMKMGPNKYTPSDAMYNYTLSKSRYYFTPIKYDFDQSGHVGVEDIKIILYNYGYFDTAFDPSGTVDIYDVVKVAKAYCTKVPPPIPKP